MGLCMLGYLTYTLSVMHVKPSNALAFSTKMALNKQTKKKEIIESQHV